MLGGLFLVGIDEGTEVPDKNLYTKCPNDKEGNRIKKIKN
jgi:hypothetical protein